MPRPHCLVFGPVNKKQLLLLPISSITVMYRRQTIAQRVLVFSSTSLMILGIVHTVRSIRRKQLLVVNRRIGFQIYGWNRSRNDVAYTSLAGPSAPTLDECSFFLGCVGAVLLLDGHVF